MLHEVHHKHAKRFTDCGNLFSLEYHNLLSFSQRDKQTDRVGQTLSRSLLFQRQLIETRMSIYIR